MLRSILPVRLLVCLVAFVAMVPVVLAQEGQIRAVHLSAGAPSFDLAVGDSLPQTLDRILFGTASQTLATPAGLTHVVFSMVGDTTPIIAGDLNVPANTRLNVLLLNTPEFIEAKTLSYPLGLTADPDSTYLRVVHAIPDLGIVDVAIVDASGLRTVLTNVPFKSSTAFLAFPKGVIQVDLLRPGTEERIASGQRRFDGGIHSTLFLSGLPTASKLLVLNESDTARQELLEMLDGQARVRLVNVLRGSGDIRLFIDTVSNAVQGGIGYREASGTTSFTTGLRRFIGVGAVDSDTLFSVILATEGNTVHTLLYLADSPPDSMPTILLYDLDRLIPADSALVRFGSAIRDTARLSYTLIDEAGVRHTRASTPFKDFSDYVSVPTGRITVEIARGAQVLFRRRGVVDGKNAYTAIATGGYSDSLFAMNLLRDSDSSRQEPMVRMTEPEGALRIVHVAPNGKPIEVILDENPAATRQLRFRDAGPVIDDYVDAIAVNVARPGRGLGAAYFDTTAFVAYDSLATMFLLSTAQDSALTAVVLYSGEQDIPDSSRAAIRVLHGAYDAGAVVARIRLANGVRFMVGPIDFMQSTPYMMLPPGRTRVTLFAAGDTTTPLLDVEGMLEAEGLYTAVITGERLENTLGVNLLDDLDESEQIPMILFGTPAGVRSAVASRSVRTSVTPNPTAADATLRLELDRDLAVGVTIHDMSGVERASLSTARLGAGVHSLPLPLENLTSGDYVVAVRDAGGLLIVATRLTVVR